MEITHNSFGKANPNNQEQEMPKNNLLQLLELGRIEDEIEIQKVSFSLRTLSAIELSAIYKEFGDALNEIENKKPEDAFVENNSNYLALSTAILSHAIMSVNGRPIEQFVESSDGEDIIALKKDIIANFQWPIIHRLMEFYNQMAIKANAGFGEELKK